MDLSIFLPDIFRNLRQLLTADCDHLHQKGCRINTVLTMNMPFHRQTTGRLAADNGIRLLHLCRNILKSNGNLITFLPKALRHTV